MDWLAWYEYRVDAVPSPVPRCQGACPATRNGLPFHAASESYKTELLPDAERVAELRRLLGEFFGLEGYWCWFTLNEAAEELTFPRCPVRAA